MRSVYYLLSLAFMLLVAAPAAQAQTGDCGALPNPPGGNVIDLGNKGLDPGEVIDSFIQQWLDPGNEVHIPAGTYQWNGGAFDGKTLSNSSLVGDGEVILDAGDNYDWSETWKADGDFEMRNITLDGVRGGEDDANIRVLATDPDATIVFRNFNQPDGGNAGSTTPGIFVNKFHEGTFYLIDSHIEGFGDNGLYASAPAKTGGSNPGGNGEVHVIRGLFKNNNISNVRIGSDNSSVRGAVIVQDETNTGGCNSEDCKGQNQRGLRVCVENEGDNLTIEDVSITQRDVGNSSGALVVACGDGGGNGNDGTINDVRIENDIATNPINFKASNTNWTGSNIEITGSGDLTPNGGSFSNVCQGSGCEIPQTLKPAVCRGEEGGGGETDRLTVDQSAGTWYDETLGEDYSKPVAFLEPPSYNGTQPGAMRLRNVGSGDFEYQLAEWEYLDGGHIDETVGYAVLERSAALWNGTPVEIGTIETDENWIRVDFSQDFSSVPSLVTQAQTENGGQTVVTRVRNLTADGFEVRLQEEEGSSDGGGHIDETIGYLAVTITGEDNAGITYEAGRTGNTVEGTDASGDPIWTTINYARAYSDPVFIGWPRTFDGNQPIGLRYQNAQDGSIEVFAEEEQSDDPEMGHATEIVDYVVFSRPGVINSGALAAKQAGGGAIAEVSEAEVMPSEFALEGNYPNPFNPATTIRYELPEAAKVTLRVFDVLGREVAVLIDRQQEAGRKTVHFDASDLPSGTYIYRLTAGSFTQTKKMMFVK